MIESDLIRFEFVAAIGALLVAYAEIHYKFRGIRSRYRMSMPEVIADAPRRLEPHRDLPILLLIKDAHRFPIELAAVEVSLSAGQGPPRSQRFRFDEMIAAPWWYRVLWLSRHHDDLGWRIVTVNFEVLVAGKKLRFSSDNYRLTSHRPFQTYFADEGLPCPAGYYTGDLHTHSWYTSDQVEFGAPLAAMREIARAMGHHFLAITDHSYDLDDEPDNYLRNDPQRKKWLAFREEVQQLDREGSGFVVIPGEEVSCGNHRGENVHFLVFDNAAYLPGAGDSGEKWLHTKPDLSIAEVLQQTANNALHFAAHPQVAVPWLQRLLLRRGRWHPQDYRHARLNGLQIWNSNPDGIHAAEQNWLRLLLQGRKLTLIAGSDAHGNFNRFRQITLPHLLMAEHERFHLFGQQRTIVHLRDELSLPALGRTLREGSAAVTSGPFLAITGQQPGQPPLPMGGILTGTPAYLETIAYSTAEYGTLRRLIIYRGDLQTQTEAKIVDTSLAPGSLAYRATIPLLEPTVAGSYYRAELLGESGGDLPVRALTNPIWHLP